MPDKTQENPRAETDQLDDDEAQDEDVVATDQCSFFVRHRLINIAVLKGAACEGELLCEIVKKDFAVDEHAVIKAPKQDF